MFDEYESLRRFNNNFDYIDRNIIESAILIV